MTEGKCEVCNVDVDPKYKFCLKCARGMKDLNKAVGAVNSESNSDVVVELSKINTNIYAIRTIKEFELKKKGFVLQTNAETKRFEIVKVKKGKA